MKECSFAMKVEYCGACLRDHWTNSLRDCLLRFLLTGNKQVGCQGATLLIVFA